MEELEGMTERERVMWGLIEELCKRVSEVDGCGHVYTMLSNARIELGWIASKEETNASDKQPSNS